MSRKKFNVGDLILILKGDWAGKVGIISKPVTEQVPGHVLIHEDGAIIGMDASIEDIKLADDTDKGYTQLGYHLIKLGSLVIEQKLLLYRN
jgi:hypothetical protein